MGSFQLWEYAVETPSGFKCEFCGEEYAGNTTRLMWHLARIEGHDINICPLVSEDVQKEAYAYATIEEIHSRKRVSSSTDAFLSSKCTRISNPTNGIDAATATPSSSMKNWGPVGTYPPVKTMGDRLLITEIVGKQFNKYINDIWFCLMDDDVLKCGICGAGGVGKTEVAKHINNLLLRVPNKFHHVFWVNASPDWSILNQATLSPHYRIHKMQSLISKAVGVDLSDGDDENKRAAQLFKVLTEKKKCVVILDDVWDYISLEGVGIPVGVDQCTVVVTTRSLEVCRQLNCQRRIEIECLMPDESYELYRKILGKDTTLSEESEKISNSIVDKCGGLPLAITIMARNMRGITDAGRLRSALDGYMWKKAVAEIFQKLKLSYDYLKDPTLQHCFLYCPLFVGEGYRTLEMFLVHEGILKRMTSRRKELDEANTMVKILQDACLLEIDDDYLVQMNEMIRSMALQIMEENQQRVMIKGGMSLQVLPDVGSWTEDLVRVSLTESTRIENIPLNYSPSCSKLSTLLLTGNLSLTYIGDSFFEGLPGLKVLCLSETRIESLPVSLFGLVNLTTLLLFKCEKLRKIPSVAKLRALKTLDLSFSGLEEVPDDIEMLLELKHLDLFESQVKELKSGIFANLSYMQFLSLPLSLAIKAEEIACLSRLEFLTCRFTDVVELNTYLMPLEGFKEREPPLTLVVQAGELNIQCPLYTAFGICFMSDVNDWFHDGIDDCYLEKSVLGLHNCDLNGLVDLKNNFLQIVVVKCHESRSFCGFSPIKNAAEFKLFSVRECNRLEFLFSLSLPAKGILEKLENISLIELKNFSSLFSRQGGVPLLLPYGTCFSHLRRFFIRDCPSIKQLFPLDLLPNLKNLEVIDVCNCALMEEIFAIEEHEEEEGNKMVEQINSFNLPKLCWFRLRDLPELKSICCVRIVCDALENIDLKSCPKLKMDDVQVYHTNPRQSLEMVSFR